MTRPASVTQSDLSRALRAAADAGLPVAEIIMEPRMVRVLLGTPKTVATPADQGQGPKPKDWPSG